MNDINFKKKVLEEAKNKQQQLIDDFTLRIEQMKSSQMNMNEGQYDNDQTSHDDAENDLISKLAEQLDFAVEEMNVLNKLKIDGEKHEAAELGAIVKTDKMTFFPSVSVEEMNVDGQNLFGLSVHSPLFREMKGKKIGDSFSYNDQDYNIEEIA